LRTTLAMSNAEVASALREIATLLGLEDAARFKVRAYERGAAAVESLAEDVGELVRAGRLRRVPGIGPTLARTIGELTETGESALLHRLREGAPPGAAELAAVLTRRQMIALHEALGVASLADLKAAGEAGRIRAVPRFGARSERRILMAIAALQAPDPRVGLAEAARQGERLIDQLRRAGIAGPVALAGDFRRRTELIGELDVVVASADHSEPPAAVLERAIRIPLARHATLPIPSEARLRLVTGLDARVWAVPPDAYATALVRATGSAAHLDKLARLGAARGIRWEADGLYRGAERLTVGTEGDLYRQLGLPEIPPELREDAGEIEAALAGSLPADLVRVEDVRGFVHCHTRYSDGRHTVEEMARAADARGLAYLTITDHSPTASYARGLEVERLRRQWDEIASVQERVRVRLLRGTECDILRDGALDYPDDVLGQLDIVIASVHQRHRMNPAEMTRRLVRAMRHPLFKVWGHPLGRYVASRPPIECDMGAVLDAIADARAAIEINGDPQRLDLPPRWIREARARGLRFVISTDAHSTGALEHLRWGVDMARRGWVRRDEVLNTRDVDAFRQAVRP
jgi:DNA polymerase (family 10)